MHEFEVSKVIDAPVDRVWDLLDDFANTYVYHPIVERSFSVNGKQKGLGARRQCTMYDGNSVQEEVREHDPVARTSKIVVVDHGPFPMKHMEVTISVQPDEGGTRVTYAGKMLPKFGPMGWMMAKTMMIPQFRKMMGQLIDGVETHLATGRLIGKKGELGPLVEAAA